MCTDTNDIKDIVFTLSYPKERANSTATVPIVLEEEIGGRIPAFPATIENIKSMRSGAGFHGGMKEYLEMEAAAGIFARPTPTCLARSKGGGKGSA